MSSAMEFYSRSLLLIDHQFYWKRFLRNRSIDSLEEENNQSSSFLSFTHTQCGIERKTNYWKWPFEMHLFTAHILEAVYIKTSVYLTLEEALNGSKERWFIIHTRRQKDDYYECWLTISNNDPTRLYMRIIPPQINPRDKISFLIREKKTFVFS